LFGIGLFKEKGTIQKRANTSPDKNIKFIIPKVGVNNFIVIIISHIPPETERIILTKIAVKPVCIN
jgi:hypothetical protein